MIREDNVAQLSLDPLIRPRSVALVGASGSNDPTNIAFTPVLYLRNYQPNIKVYAVNPKYKEIAGYPCYPSLSDIPGEVESVLVLVPAKHVAQVVREAVGKRAKAVIITSSGFAETGSEGKEQQEYLARLARENSLLLLGPNSNGIVNIVDGIPLGFSPALEGEELHKGGIGFVSQSGATMSAIVSRAKAEGTGFSYLVSTGNEACLDVSDIIRFMVDDPHTKVIMALVEGLDRGAKFLKVADYALAHKKPLVVLKLGRTESASRAVASHTGKMAGSFPVYQGVFKQKGILVATDIDDFLAKSTYLQRFPLAEGNGVGIMSTSGGAAELVADKAVEMGLSVPELKPETCRKLKEKLRWFSTPKNPFDFAGQVLKDETIFDHVVECLASDPGIDALIFAMTAILVDERLISSYLKYVDKLEKPFVFLWLSGTMGRKERGLLSGKVTPVSRNAGECLSGLSALVSYGAFLKERAQRKEESAFPIPNGWARACSSLLPQEKTTLSERETKKILSLGGIPVTREELAKSADQAADLAASLGYPVALKVESEGIVHKTELGGLKLGLTGGEEVKKAFANIMDSVKKLQPEARLAGVLVQEMVEKGWEMIIGLNRDEQFGTVIMAGLGGIWAEVLKDVSFRAVPITHDDALGMINELRVAPLLKGARGKEGADLAALADIMVRVSYLGEAMGERLRELDINPLLVFSPGRGAKVVDATLVLKGENG